MREDDLTGGESWTEGFPRFVSAPHLPCLPPRYRLVRLLGSGGQGDVWLAHDQHLDQLVAVKIFSSDMPWPSVARMQREVLLGRELVHPNLVRVFELIEGDGCWAVAMEWVPGGSVKAWLQSGPLPIDEVFSVAEQTLRALAFLHERGVVHRDVKPSNLLVALDRTIKLGDLGLARRFDAGARETLTAFPVGTLPYMSPECRMGEAASPASDLYSLGVTLFELLTGHLPGQHSAEPHRPWKGTTSAHDPRCCRHQCPGWLARFVMRLLERKPQDRFADGQEALKAFRRRRAVVLKSRLRPLGVACLAAIAAFFGFWGFGWQNRGHRAPVASLTAEGSRLIALDAPGRELWGFAFSSAVREVDRVDLDGDGNEEVVAVAYPDTGRGQRMAPAAPAEVAILDDSGRLESLFRPESFLARYPTPFGPPRLVPSLVLLDVDHDGRKDAVLNCRHRILGSAYLFVYSRKLREWLLLLGHEGGWIFNVAAVPAARRPTLRFYAFNSLIGTFAVVGQVSWSWTDARSVAPMRGWTASGVSWPVWISWDWYTPLGQATPQPAEGSPPFAVDAEGRTSFRVVGRPLGVDVFGNPVPGVNVGRNLSLLRLGFFDRLSGLYEDAFFTAGGLVEAKFRAFQEEFGEPSVEPPYRAIVALFEARALARTGDLVRALAILEKAFQESHNEGLGLALANLEAMTGDFPKAVRLLQEMAVAPETPAGWFRGPQLLGRIAIATRDEALWHSCLGGWPRTVGEKIPLFLEAQRRVWWDEATVEDCEVPATDLVPEGEALACLARWRLGRLAPDDLQRMAQCEKANPDAIPECSIGLAVVLSSVGRQEEALEALQKAEELLVPKHTYDFYAHQVWQLARACTAKVLWAAGRQDKALALARSLQPTLAPGLLPGLLVEEVLAGRTVSAR